MPRRRTAHAFLPQLRDDKVIFDSILLEIISTARQHHLTTNDRVYFQDKIASANRHGLDNKDAETLIRQLEHFSKDAAYRKTRRR